MPTLEEITYEAGRAALAEQAAFVEGIRQRTGMLLTAHALVASFIGGTTVSKTGLDGWVWLALVALLLGLVTAAVLPAPWRLSFSVDARELFAQLYDQAAAAAEDGTLDWLPSAGYAFLALRERNEPAVRRMSHLSGTLAALVVVQTLAWFGGLT